MGRNNQPINKTHERKMEVKEMRMLRWMYDYARKYKIMNEVVRARLRVARISTKLCDGRLRWFGRMQRKASDALVRRVVSITIGGKRDLDLG